jgi:hypothetical protein
MPCKKVWKAPTEPPKVIDPVPVVLVVSFTLSEILNIRIFSRQLFGVVLVTDAMVDKRTD